MSCCLRLRRWLEPIANGKGKPQKSEEEACVEGNSENSLSLSFSTPICVCMYIVLVCGVVYSCVYGVFVCMNVVV